MLCLENLQVPFMFFFAKAYLHFIIRYRRCSTICKTWYFTNKCMYISITSGRLGPKNGLFAFSTFFYRLPLFFQLQIFIFIRSSFISTCQLTLRLPFSFPPMWVMVSVFFFSVSNLIALSNQTLNASKNIAGCFPQIILKFSVLLSLAL